MAKQTFTTGQVLTAAQMTSLQQTAMGGGSTTAKTASYVLVAADAGTVVQMNSASATTITVNTALFAAGDTVQIQNVGAGVCTVTAGTATVSTSSTLALKQYDAGTLYFNSTSAAIFFATDAADSTSPLTTKGDLYGFSTLDARIPIGTNNQVLTADSAQALGLKWATPATLPLVGCGLSNYYTTIASTTGVAFVVPFAGADNWDTNSFHNPASNNSRVTIPTGYGGKYMVISQAWPETFSSYFINQVFVNGAAMLGNPIKGVAVQGQWARADTQVVTNATLILDLTAGDYIEQAIQVPQTASNRYITNFQITYLGA